MCKNNEKGFRPSPQKEALISLFLYFSLWVKACLASKYRLRSNLFRPISLPRFL